MYHLPYNKTLKEYSRYLRKRSTLGEVLLWNEIKAGKLMGYTFNRQKPIDKYIVDFYCRPLNLVIEIDGEVHLEDDIRLNDIERQAAIEQLGVQFLRFEDVLVRKHMDQVIGDIQRWIMAAEKTLI